MTPLAELFTHPLQLSASALWLVAPLCVAVAVVYRTIRVHTLQGLPMAILKLSLQILLGVAAIMLVGWAFITWIC